MNENNVAGRYAKALQLLTERHVGRSGPALVEQLERTLDDLRGLAELVRPGSRLGDLLTHPQVRPDDRRALLRKALEGRAIRTVVVFGDLLLRKKRLALASQIAVDFEGIVERAKGVYPAQVVSAEPLTPQEIRRLHAGLEKLTGGKIALTAAVDESLVGGAFARIGDRLVERSVKSMLQTIAHQLYEVRV
jgi:F-type H+-transporting ATPase subunit delta